MMAAGGGRLPPTPQAGAKGILAHGPRIAAPIAYRVNEEIVSRFDERRCQESSRTR